MQNDFTNSNESGAGTGASANAAARPVIALDGPAGSGKSSVAGRVAERLGYIHADSGAIYRTLTLALIERIGAGSSPEDFGVRLADYVYDPRELSVDVELTNGRQSNRFNGVDVGDRIRTPEVTARIRYIADMRACRERVNELLRNFALQASLVVDGRDIGSIVFPETPFKFYLDASVEERARRRAAELRAKGIAFDPDRLEAEIAARDEQDRGRDFGALVQASDAILIDTSRLSLEDVLHRILSRLQIQF